MYGREVVKGVQDLLKNSTPFKMAIIVSSSCFLFFTNIFGFFFLCLCFCILRADECVWRLHGHICTRVARVLYNKVQAKSRVPKLEKELEQARLEWAKLPKERTAWIANVKKTRKLEADVVDLEKSITQLRSIHQADLERKDAFCEAKKAMIATELQASYNAK